LYGTDAESRNPSRGKTPISNRVRRGRTAPSGQRPSWAGTRHVLSRKEGPLRAATSWQDGRSRHLARETRAPRLNEHWGQVDPSARHPCPTHPHPRVIHAHPVPSTLPLPPILVRLFGARGGTGHADVRMEGTGDTRGRAHRGVNAHVCVL
jgi:hypothetical protein